MLHREEPRRRPVRRLVDGEALGRERHGEVLPERLVLVGDERRPELGGHGVEVRHVLVDVAAASGPGHRQRGRDLLGDLSDPVGVHPALEPGMPDLGVLGNRGQDQIHEVLDVDGAALGSLEEVEPLVRA